MEATQEIKHTTFVYASVVIVHSEATTMSGICADAKDLKMADLANADMVVAVRASGTGLVIKDRFGPERTLGAPAVQHLLANGERNATQDVHPPIDPWPDAGPMPGEAWVLAIRQEHHAESRVLPFAALIRTRGVDYVEVLGVCGALQPGSGEKPRGVRLDSLDRAYTRRLSGAMPLVEVVERAPFEQQVAVGAAKIADLLEQLGVHDSNEPPEDDGEGNRVGGSDSPAEILARAVLVATNKIS